MDMAIPLNILQSAHTRLIDVHDAELVASVREAQRGTGPIAECKREARRHYAKQIDQGKTPPSPQSFGFGEMHEHSRMPDFQLIHIRSDSRSIDANRTGAKRQPGLTISDRLVPTNAIVQQSDPEQRVRHADRLGHRHWIFWCSAVLVLSVTIPQPERSKRGSGI